MMHQAHVDRSCDSQPRITYPDASEWQLNPGLIAGCGSKRFRRKSYCEQSSPYVGPRENQCAVVRFGDPPGYGEAESGATGGTSVRPIRRDRASASLVGTEETFKDARVKFRRDARSVIGNGNSGARLC